MTRSSRCQRGVSLLEGVLYLVIALAVLVGGMAFYRQAVLSQRITDTSRMITAVTAETRALFGAQDSLGNTFIEDYLVGSGAVSGAHLAPGRYPDAIDTPGFEEAYLRLAVAGEPEEGRSTASGKVIRHAWGGQVAVYGADDYFTITMSGLPRTACTRLARIDTVGRGLLGTGIFAIDANGEIASAGSFPVTPETAARLCGERFNTLRLGYLESAAPIHASTPPEEPDEEEAEPDTGGEPDFDYVMPTVYWPNEWGNFADWGHTVTSKWIDTQGDSFFKAGEPFRIWGPGNPTLQLEGGTRAAEGTMSRWGTNIVLDPPPCGESEYIYLENAAGEVGRLELERPAWTPEWGPPPESCN